MQTLMTRFAALEAAGFSSYGGWTARHLNWRHVQYSYITVKCDDGTWTMRSPDQSIEIKNDIDVIVALDLLTGR